MIFSSNCNDKLENMNQNGVEYYYVKKSHRNIIGYRKNFKESKDRPNYIFVCTVN
jgi:hypothetical protein